MNAYGIPDNSLRWKAFNTRPVYDTSHPENFLTLECSNGMVMPALLILFLFSEKKYIFLCVCTCVGSTKRAQLVRFLALLKTAKNKHKHSSEGATVEHIVADVRDLHARHPDAVFQVASQFNCLEMVGPDIPPEAGITRYVSDRTQGPACALACPAATLFRNYFCTPPGVQLNTLEEVERVVQNERHAFWEVHNGYCLPCSHGRMGHLSAALKANPRLATQVQDAYKVGIHWSTPVVHTQHSVSSPSWGRELLETKTPGFCKP
jgi:hypothetical protein